jgi:cytochrome c biogenesis protein CcdA/thiol-disulfide isomerase/thioredoxin
MTFFVITYLAGVLTIATPCIFPILPFVLTRVDEPFKRGGLPFLLGLAMTFTVVASLAAVAGGWAVEANRYGRVAAVALLTLFGATMLWPGLATAIARPIATLGARLGDWASPPATSKSASAASSLLLGVAAGLLWAPCAGSVLGLILTGAALRGPSLETSLLLLSYGMGAATALAAGVLISGRVFTAIKRSIRWGDRLRRLSGMSVMAGAAVIWLGLDNELLQLWPSSTAAALEHTLLVEVRKEPAMTINATQAAANPTAPTPLGSLLMNRQWLNTRPLQPDDLRGKVVLVNFWTYSCINCLRALPYVRGWAKTYGDRGLRVVGVHTPEFAFEKELGNVSKALVALGITYPVAIDSDFSIWRAFGNQAWPALYFIGADGRVRHRALGEGDYEQSEMLIRHLLSEATTASASFPIAPVIGEGIQAEADPRNLRSGETYIGYAQASGFASLEPIQRDAPASYKSMSRLPINQWSLEGRWNVGAEFATLNESPGGITYRFHARDLHLVLAPANPGQSARFRVLLDGAPPGAQHGVDVDVEGWGRVQDGRLYQLIRQTGPVTDHTFKIEFLDAGVRAYAFTFG